MSCPAASKKHQLAVCALPSSGDFPLTGRKDHGCGSSGFGHHPGDELSGAAQQW